MSKETRHRAKERLEKASPKYKWLIDACSFVRLNDEITWPNHVFCPIEKFQNIALSNIDQAGIYHLFDELDHLEKTSMFSSGLTWAAWRMTQGIYRFDETIYNAVIFTEKMGDIPSQILRRLPEWCVYIETPGLTCDLGEGERTMHGVWACFSLNHNNEVLVIHPDIDSPDEPTPLCLHIDTNVETIQKSVNTAIDTNSLNHQKSIDLQNWLPKVLNLLLYLCTDSEITHKSKISPGNPVPKKTKKGLKLFPAKGITSWDVGVRMGAALRFTSEKTESSNQIIQGERTVRPHIRRAHWRTIVSGKRKDAKGDPISPQKRKRELRWQPPVSVNLNDQDLPAVIRKVK